MAWARSAALVGFGLAVLSVATALPDRPPGAVRPALERQVPSDSVVTADLASYLPRAGEVPGWSPRGEPLVYSGDDLFTYIDGGADIYNEYGFRRVIVQDYGATPEKPVTLEIFEMADAAASFGMFSFKTSARGFEIPLGQGGRLEDYYLNFWKGAILVTVTGFDESAENVEAIRGIAAAVDGKIKGEGEKPGLAAAFPSEWAARGGLKYLRGPIGLRNQHPVFARQPIRFHEGVAGSPADGVLAVILRGKTPAEAAAILQDAEKAFSSGPPFSDFRKEDGKLEARDNRGNLIKGRLLDGVVGLLIGNGPAAGEEGIWERLRSVASGGLAGRPTPQ